ncbi:MAG: threonylcarbamoyl-AMP synthase [Deltaproteobacteria bacterium]|jgi:L-threonylcarbamoyladenylate synthase|nr:threonylcarbamoyl-AMP synthase [Deltaproteobacteria bacterium]
MDPQILSLEASCEALRRGSLLIFPTETFYGLGCNALDPDAVGAVFSLKKRALCLPLPLVLSRRERLEALVEDIPPAASELMDKFWPGPLSFVLPAREDVPDLLTANSRRLAVRCSSHPAVIALCEMSGFVLVASSANISGNPPVCAPEMLDPELTAGVAGVFVAGPPPAGGLPSTVLEIRQQRGGAVIHILRPGAVSAATLAQTGLPVLLGGSAPEAS